MFCEETSPMFSHWEQHWFDLSDTLNFRPCLIKIAESSNTSAESKINMVQWGKMHFARCGLLGMFFHLLPDPKVKAGLSSRARLILWAKWRMSGTKLWLKWDRFGLEMPVSTSIPKRSFSLIRLIVLMGWYCIISQGKVLVLDIFTNI